MKFFNRADIQREIGEKRFLMGPQLCEMMKEAAASNQRNQLPLHQIWKLRLQGKEVARASFIDFPINASGVPSLGDSPLYYEALRHYIPSNLANKLRMSTGYHICRKDPLIRRPSRQLKDSMCVLCHSIEKVQLQPNQYLFVLLAVWVLDDIKLSPFIEIHEDLDLLSRVEIMPWGLPRKRFFPSFEGIDMTGDFIVRSKWHWEQYPTPNSCTFQVIVDRASRGDANYIGVLGRILDQITMLKKELGPNLVNLFGWS